MHKTASNRSREQDPDGLRSPLFAFKDEADRFRAGVGEHRAAEAENARGRVADLLRAGLHIFVFVFAVGYADIVRRALRHTLGHRRRHAADNRLFAANLLDDMAHAVVERENRMDAQQIARNRRRRADAAGFANHLERIRRQQNFHPRVFVVQIFDDRLHRLAIVEPALGLDHARALGHRIGMAIHDEDLHAAFRVLLAELRRRRMRRRVGAAAARVDGDIERLLHPLTVVFLEPLHKFELGDLRRRRQAGRVPQHLAELLRREIDALGVALAIQRDFETQDINIMLLSQLIRQIAGRVRQNDKLAHFLLPFEGTVLRRVNQRTISQKYHIRFSELFQEGKSCFFCFHPALASAEGCKTSFSMRQKRSCQA